jgi:putative glycosyltransferase (TIGR04372 family)
MMSSNIFHISVLSEKIMKVIRPIAYFILNFVLLIVVLPILYLIEPFLRVRITHFGADRLGHLAAEPQLWLAKCTLGANYKPRTCHILLAGNPCNKVLLELWQSRLPIIGNLFVSSIWHYCKNNLRKTRFDDPKLQVYDEYLEFDLKCTHLTFAPKHLKQGQDLSSEIGIGENDWFVALNVRDQAFNEQRSPDSPPELIDNRAKFRNQPIEDYLGAARAVTERGGYVVRMGAAVSYPLELEEPKIIDYAWNHRSDFGDVFLSGTCRFFLGGPSGMNFLPAAFGVPVAAASMPTLFPMPYGRHSLSNPILLRKRDNGELLTFREAHEYGMFTEQPAHKIWRFEKQFDTIGLDIELNTPEDNTDLCLDMLDALEGISPTEHARELQDQFKRRYLSRIRNFEYAPDIGPRFALKYRHLIEA